MTTSILLHATGSVGCGSLPFWLTFLQSQYPDLDLHVSLSRAAQTFVAPRTLAAITGRETRIDTWETPVSTADVSPHTTIAHDFDAIVVHPATMDFLARLATGRGATPVLAALQMTSAPVVIAPALPPGALRSVAVARNLTWLADDPRYTLLGMTEVASTATGESTDTGPAPLSEAVEVALDRVRAVRGMDTP